MGTECDLRKRVSNLESIGRKICSDLRNFQKERIILSEEAKCLLREIEKRKTRGRYYSNNKHGNNTSCTCTIWENDLIKNSGNDLEESSKYQNEDDQLLMCKNCCNCCESLNEENCSEDLFEIGNCSICRLNELDKSFNCTESVSIFNHNDKTNADNDSCCLDINNAAEGDINDVHYMIRSCEEACTIDFSEFCDVCVFCKENNTKNIHGMLSNHELNINNESDIRDLIKRERGGGGKSDSESTIDETTNVSICTCDCSICALRNKNGDKPPCCLRENEPDDCSIDVDYDENLQLNRSVVSEIHQYCKITKLREALEKLKNRNHTLRKLLKKRDCLIKNSTIEQSNYKSSSNKHYDDNNNGKDSKNFRDEDKETPKELVAILKILQSKCRTKDGMIVALADEFKECATDERIKRILGKLTDTKIHYNTIDFDRSTLWKYLVPQKCNLVEQHSYRRKSIEGKKAQCSDITIGIVILSFIFLANIHYRYRCTFMIVFHSICDAFYRVYEIFHNFQQCFTCNHIMILFVENCINFFETFLSLFNCRQLGINIENITCDFTLFSDDGFPWLSIIVICATIFILFLYRVSYPFIAMYSASLQYIYDTRRNDVQNDCD